MDPRSLPRAQSQILNEKINCKRKASTEDQDSGQTKGRTAQVSITPSPSPSGQGPHDETEGMMTVAMSESEDEKDPENSDEESEDDGFWLESFLNHQCTCIVVFGFRMRKTFFFLCSKSERLNRSFSSLSLGVNLSHQCEIKELVTFHSSTTEQSETIQQYNAWYQKHEMKQHHMT